MLFEKLLVRGYVRRPFLCSFAVIALEEAACLIETDPLEIVIFWGIQFPLHWLPLGVMGRALSHFFNRNDSAFELGGTRFWIYPFSSLLPSFLPLCDHGFLFGTRWF